MATIAEWKKLVTDQFIADPQIQDIYGLDPDLTFEQQFSKVSIESILFYCIAFVAYTLDVLFAKKEAEIDAKLASMRPHTIAWYISKVRAFQNGYDLPNDSEVYATIDESAKIIQYCSIVDENILKIKLAGDSNGIPYKIDDDALARLRVYLNRIKDAGTHYELISREADYLRISLLIHYDPLVMTSTGAYIDGSGETPIADAIKAYLKSMPFDGIYSNMALTDAIQSVRGVVVAQLTDVQSQYGLYPFTPVISVYKPDAGYMTLDELTITYQNYGV